MRVTLPFHPKIEGDEMRNVTIFVIFIVTFAIATDIVAFDTRPIDIARTGRITPGPGAIVTSPDSVTIDASLSRPIIIFDLPDGFLDEDNLILEALLTVRITPAIDWDGTSPITAYCIPITASVGPTPTWGSLHSAYDIDYGEFGVFKPDSGTIFFEVSHMLYSATDGDVSFHGVMLIPASGSAGFSISAVPNPIDFRVANFPGKKEVRD